MRGASFLLLLAGLLLVACGGTDTTPVPPITLRSAAGEEQVGALNSSCWSKDGLMVCGDGPLRISSAVLTVRAGETMEVDFSLLGSPKQAGYAIYRYDERQWRRGSGPRAPLTLATSPSDPAWRDDLALTPLADVRLDLPPGEYALTVFARFAEGDTLQGFHLTVR